MLQLCIPRSLPFLEEGEGKGGVNLSYKINLSHVIRLSNHLRKLHTFFSCFMHYSYPNFMTWLLVNSAGGLVGSLSFVRK